jgi:hypothetical protein
VLARRLTAAGARAGRDGEWRTFDLGEQATASSSGPLRTLDSFGARVAVGPFSIVLARTDAARAALLGRGDSPLTDPGLAFAVTCLGEVEAARTLPGTFTHNSVDSPQLIAIGSRPAPARQEVLCAVGGSEAGADPAGQAEALKRTFAADAKEPLTGQPMRDLVTAASVDELSEDGFDAARAVLELGPRAPRGVLFGALVRGSLLAYVGAPEPLADD